MHGNTTGHGNLRGSIHVNVRGKRASLRLARSLCTRRIMGRTLARSTDNGVETPPDRSQLRSQPPPVPCPPPCSAAPTERDTSWTLFPEHAHQVLLGQGRVVLDDELARLRLNNAAKNHEHEPARDSMPHTERPLKAMRDPRCQTGATSPPPHLHHTHRMSSQNNTGLRSAQ